MAHEDDPMQRWNDWIANTAVSPYRPVSPIPPYDSPPGEPQGPIYQPPVQAPYAEPQGPVYQDRPGLGLGEPQGPVYMQPQPQQPQPNPMQGWADSPERGGLGLAARPSEPMAKPSLGEYMAQEMYPGADLNWLERYRLSNVALSQQYIGNRQQLAQQLAQQEEKKREFNWQEMIRIDKEFANDPERWEMAMGSLAKDRSFVPAQHMLQVGDKKMRGELEASVPFIKRYFPDFAEKYQRDPKSVNKSEVYAVLGKVKDIRAKRAQSDADSQELASLEKNYEAYLGGDAQALQPGDAERLIELRNQSEKKQLELEGLRLKNKVEQKKLDEPAGKPRQNDTLDAVAYGVFKGNDGYWGLKGTVTPEHITRAQQAGYDVNGMTVGMDQSVAADRLGQQRLGAAAGYGALAKGDMSQDVELGVNRSKYRKLMPDGTVTMPPNSKMTQRQASKQGFIDTSHAMKYIDDANDLKTVEKRVEHVHSLAKEIVKADPGFGNRIGQLTKLTANALTNAGAPTNIMSTDGKRKLTVGEVVNLYNAETQQMLEAIARSANQIKGAGTEGDVGRQMKGFSSGGDTAQTMEMKFRNFSNVFKLSRRNLYATVFGDDEADKFYKANQISEMSSDELRKALR